MTSYIQHNIALSISPMLQHLRRSYLPTDPLAMPLSKDNSSSPSDTGPTKAIKRLYQLQASLSQKRSKRNTTPPSRSLNDITESCVAVDTTSVLAWKYDEEAENTLPPNPTLAQIIEHARRENRIIQSISPQHRQETSQQTETAADTTHKPPRSNTTERTMPSPPSDHDDDHSPPYLEASPSSPISEYEYTDWVLQETAKAENSLANHSIFGPYPLQPAQPTYPFPSISHSPMQDFNMLCAPSSDNIPSYPVLTAGPDTQEDPIAEIHLSDISDDSMVSVFTNSSSSSSAASKETIRASHLPPCQPPRGWPNPNYDPSAPFPYFTRLPDEVRYRIIAKLTPPLYFPNNGVVQPYFNKGSVHVPASSACEVENFDTSLLYVGNRAWYEDATMVLYRYNQFRFDDPVVMGWWCRRIGSHLGKVGVLDLRLTVGSTAGMEAVETRDEVLWCKVLWWVRKRFEMGLMEMTLDFGDWYV